MVKINGVGVSKGTAVGKAVFLKKTEFKAEQRKTQNPAEETERFRKAAKKVLVQLDALYAEALKKSGAETAEIFEIHRMMIEDKDYGDEIESEINSGGYTAEWAVSKVSKRLEQNLSAADSDYMRARAADVRDVSERLMAVLINSAPNDIDIKNDETVIICADDLSPSETVRIDKKYVAAFATRFGSARSHTAILAGAMEIPAVISLGEALSEKYDNMTAIVDGDTGCVYIDPSPEALKAAQIKIEKEKRYRERMHRFVGKEDVTSDGYKVMLYANIGTADDAESAIENDASGIGLFRTEFLYMEENDFPGEEKQFNAYKTVAEKMNGKRVIIRTVDVGADKKIDYFGLEPEENPALGFRAIRICLCRENIFKTQLRALLRASAFGKLSVMLPMIISVEEVRKARRILDDVKAELRDKKIPFDNEIELGIMIETPSAVMISDLLAKEADFFSIGTNDLTQYTLAADRQNPNLAEFFDPYSTAVLRMIKMTADNAHKSGIWCGICGELAADEKMTETFLAMGIDELSVSPRAILPLREKIRGVNVSAIKDEILNNI